MACSDTSVPRGVAGSDCHVEPDGSEFTASHTSALDEVKSKHSSFNRLQFVCKILHHETHLLEVKFNTLSFASYVDYIYTPFARSKSATCTCFSFIAKIPSYKRTWIRQVEIRSGMISVPRAALSISHPIYDSKETLFRLANICRSNTGIEVKYRLSGCSQAYQAMVPAISAVILVGDFLFLLRQKQLGSAVLPNTLHSLLMYQAYFGFGWGKYKMGVDLQRETDVQRWQAPNLRFYPMEDLAVKGQFETYGTFILPDGRDAIPVWQDLVKGWLEKSF